MDPNFKCPACGGATSRGFIFDRGHYEYKTQQAWVEGEPTSSFWSGLETDGRDVRTVDAYRCGGCGRLEFFAADAAEI
ncbi:MAG: hypothetical protein IT174_03740 [Acidobacteria bacterium]|nr:hypothetical protein [Acidobacteriota bacterium]